MTASQPLKVMHFASDDGWGGAERVIQGLLEAQSRSHDIRPSLLAMNDGRLSDVARSLGLPAIVLSEKEHSFPVLLRRVRATLKAETPQILHSHRYKENILSYLSADSASCAVVVTIHGDEPASTRREDWILRVRRRLSRLLATRVGAHFAVVSRDLTAHLGLPPDRCTWIPNGIQLPQLVPSRGASDSQSSARTIGWIGRLVPVKNVSVLLEALALLPPPFDDTRLLLVGDGPLRSEIDALTVRLGLVGRVECRGFVEDTAPELARMDVFALPSKYEGVPLALLEAMGSGLPCAASAVGGIPDVAGTDDFLLLVHDPTPAGWCSALMTILREPETARKRGLRARESVARRFSESRTSDAYCSLYQKLARSGRHHFTSPHSKAR